jgi:uridine phosphorylase
MTVSMLPITHLPVGSVPESVIVCGDPARAGKIADKLDDARLLAENREYRAFFGRYLGTPIGVCSHGIGAPGAAIAFEELIEAGARCIIRVGTCGALQPDMASGELVIATAAVQRTGYGRETAPTGYPAVADPDLVAALRQAAAERSQAYRLGIVVTRDGFYQRVRGPAAPDYRVLSAAGVLAVEMECAALFLVAAMRGARGAAILAVDGNVLSREGEDMASYQPDMDVVHKAVESEIQLALLALHHHVYGTE